MKGEKEKIKTAKSGKGVRLVSLLLAAMMVIGMLVVLPITSAAEEGKTFSVSLGLEPASVNLSGFASALGATDFVSYHNKVFSESYADVKVGDDTYALESIVHTATQCGTGNLNKAVYAYNKTDYTLIEAISGETSLINTNKRRIAYYVGVYSDANGVQFVVLQGHFVASNCQVPPASMA